jgi:hypothetical protein
MPEASELDQARYRLNHPPVVAETIEGEGVAIDLKTGRYFSLLGSAAEIWRCVIDGYSAAEILAAAGEPGERTVQAESLRRFIASLLSEGLICLREGAAPVRPLTPLKPWAHEAPKLECFNDMQDMLTLDPIHEIDDDFGWPRPAQGV